MGSQTYYKLIGKKLIMYCSLDLDQKTFEYIHRYMANCHSPNDFFQMDNDLQLEEIQKHLELNHNFTTEEQLEWVKNYSKGFREYINTMKLVWASWLLLGKCEEDFTFEEFAKIKERLPYIKEVLEGIHN